MSRSHMSLIALGLFTAAATARATTITQDHYTRTSSFYNPYFDNVAANNQFGELFSPDASVAKLSSIGFYYADQNTSQPAVMVSATLYAGVGNKGTVLGTRSITIDPTGGSRYVDFSFAGTSLTPDALYTINFVQTGGYRGAYQSSIPNENNNGDYTDYYPRGRFYYGGDDSVSDFGEIDMRFRITGSAVPEPAGLTALALGVAGLCRRPTKSRRT